jgi:hypothetical protein
LRDFRSFQTAVGREWWQANDLLLTAAQVSTLLWVGDSLLLKLKRGFDLGRL